MVDTLISNGDTKRATAYALHLYNTQRREGFSYSTQMGYPSLLASAKTLLDAGGVVAGKINQGQGAWYESADAAIEAGHTRSRDRLSTSDLALRIAQQVVKENPKNVLRMKGQHLIAEIIERGGEVDPAVLYEAAEGKYFAEKDQVALSSFKQVLAALEGKDKAMRVELGPKTFLRMGNTYKAMDLAFEAAMAYREGCTTWRGDPENDQHNANGYYKMMQELTQQSPGDAVLKQMFEESQNIAAELSTRDQDQILFDQAESMRRKREYPGAIAKYKQIKQSAIDYEKALVNIAVCTNRSGKADEAHLLFVDYIEKFVKDPKNAVTGSKVVKRTDAMATASFYRCFHLFNKEKYSEVISTSAKYYEDFPDQTNMAPWTMGMVGASYAKTEKIAEAKAMLLELMANYTDSVRISPLSNSIYAELTKSLEGTTDPAKRAELLTEMALLLETGNSTAPKPSMTNLRNESKHWIELENWEKAVAVLERIVEKFGDDPEQSKSMAAYIKPDLAQSYLELERVAEAYVILSEMMSSLDGKPSKRTGFNYARSVIGWVHGSASDIVEVPGAGQTEEAMKEAVDKLNSLSNSVKEKWTCEWYELKFMQAYGYYRWATAEGGPKDGTKMASAKRQLDNIVQQLGINFKGKDGVPGVDQMCVQDEDRASQLGEDVLRRRMVWLWGKVKNAK
ncbi:MAG: tetratricopeptide (TPR) repeat protein [Planctomycetota bacterium]